MDECGQKRESCILKELLCNLRLRIFASGLYKNTTYQNQVGISYKPGANIFVIAGCIKARSCSFIQVSFGCQNETTCWFTWTFLIGAFYLYTYNFFALTSNWKLSVSLFQLSYANIRITINTSKNQESKTLKYSYDEQDNTLIAVSCEQIINHHVIHSIVT